MSLAWPAVLLVAVAPVIGSFLGVLHDRLPRGESIVHPPSHCRRCGTRLGATELVPIVCYLVAGGRCRHCRGAIGADLLWLELSATAAALVIVLVATTWGDALAGCVFAWILLALAAIDLRHHLLPDPLTGALAVTGIGAALLGAGPAPSTALVGALAGGGGFLAVRWLYAALRGREGLGLGDVKLMAGLGAWFGPGPLLALVMLAASGGLAAVVLHAAVTGRRLAGDVAAPFGTMLSLAGLALWVALRATQG